MYKRNQKSIFAVTTLLATLGCACFLSGRSNAQEPPKNAQPEKGPELTRFDLSEYPLATEENELSPIKVAILADESQKLGDGGLKLNLQIENTSKQPISIFNPLDFLRFNLSDQDGTSFNLPPVANRFQINRGNDNSRLEYSFKVSKVTRDDKILNDEEAYNTPFTLPVNSVIEFAITIDKIQNSSKRPIQTISVPVGQYKVVGTIALLNILTPRVQRNLRSPEVPIELVE